MLKFSIKNMHFLGWWICILLQLYAVTADYPGVIELVGYNNRHARTRNMKQQQQQQPEVVSRKIQDDIETVKRNIDKYNKLLTMDTNGLPDSQKDMLERIVERVARLKESLDINEKFVSKSNIATTTTNMDLLNTSTETMEDKLPSTIMMLHTDIATNTDDLLTQTEQATYDNTAIITEMPTTGLSTNVDMTNTDFQMIAARSNNNKNAASIISNDVANVTSSLLPTTKTLTTSGSQRTLTTISKLSKTRATKRPNQHLSSSSSSSSSSTSTSSVTNYVGNNANTPINHNTPVKRIQQQQQQQQLQQKQQLGATSTTTMHKQKITTTNPFTTMSPQQKFQLQQQQQQQQHKVTTDDRLTPALPQIGLGSSGTGTDGVALKQQTDGMSLVYSSQQQQQQQQQQLNSAYSNGLTPNINNYNMNAAGTYNNNNNNNKDNNNKDNDFVYDTKVNTTAIINSLNNAREEYFQQQQQQLHLQHQQQQLQLQQKESGIIANKDKMATATAKPTKYHYYPHNQHIYLLPECAIQQVCNAVYVRLNYTQPLCACPSRYRDPCSASLNEDDQHTTKLIGDGKKKAITLAKTCEATTEMRECRSPKDWSLLALQNTRTGKSHYLVICRCPEYFKMEGPMSHDQPTYASVPGIRVFGMMCVKPGYSVRKPSSQPPKRYQMQNTHYRPGNLGDSLQNSYVSGNLGSSMYLQDGTKDAYGRPSIPAVSINNNGAGYHNPQDFYHQSSHSISSQYLNRPESESSLNDVNRMRPELTSVNQLPDNIYGRTNEREGDTPIESTKDDEDLKDMATASTQALTEEPNSVLSDQKKDDNIATATEQATATGGRVKRAAVNDEKIYDADILYEETPDFPWDRVFEFQQSIVWD